MRTVLVVDEMLAHQLRKKLDGDVVAVDHMELRDLGYRAALARVRELVMKRRSVLVLGGRAWDERASVDPMTFLRDLRLQPFVPVVLLLAVGQDTPSLDWRPRIFSIVRTGTGAGLVRAIETQCRDAWAFAHQRLKPVVTRVVSLDARRPLRSARSPSRVLQLDRSGG